MASDILTFSCPACGIKLTVPVSLAGVSGPCPSCGTRIQGPGSLTPPAAAVVPPSQLQAPMPHAEEDPPPGIPHPPLAQTPAFPAPPASADLRPEPRPWLTRTAPAEVATQPLADLPHSGAMWNATALPRHPEKRQRLPRFLLALLFLIASAALVYYLLTLIQN